MWYMNVIEVGLELVIASFHSLTTLIAVFGALLAGCVQRDD